MLPKLRKSVDEVVTKFHQEMPALACSICGMCTSVSLFDWTIALGESTKTDWQDMTWDGMHWQMPVNLWKAHYALSIAGFATSHAVPATSMNSGSTTPCAGLSPSGNVPVPGKNIAGETGNGQGSGWNFEALRGWLERNLGSR